MAAYENLPWFPDSSQFLRAIIAGGDRGIQISRLQQAANEREANRPRGGFGLAHAMPQQVQPATIPAKANPNAPYIGGIPGSPMLVDPARENQPEPARVPFMFNGREMISNAAGEVVDYVPPPNLSTPFGSATEGRFQLDPRTGQPVQITPAVPRSTAGTEPRLSTVDTSNMSPDEVALAALLNPPRVSGPVSTVQSYLRGDSAPAPLPAKKDQLKNGQIYQTAKGVAVWDGDSFEPIGGGAAVAPVTAPPTIWSRFGNPSGAMGNMFGGSGDDPNTPAQ